MQMTRKNKGTGLGEQGRKGKHAPFKEEHTTLIAFFLPLCAIVMIQAYMTELIKNRDNGWIVTTKDLEILLIS